MVANGEKEVSAAQSKMNVGGFFLDALGVGGLFIQQQVDAATHLMQVNTSIKNLRSIWDRQNKLMQVRLDYSIIGDEVSLSLGGDMWELEESLPALKFAQLWRNREIQKEIEAGRALDAEKAAEKAALDAEKAANDAKLPKRFFAGVTIKEYVVERYVDDWVAKVERVGGDNYPEAARQQGGYSRLQLTVSIHADGSLEGVEVDRSSGSKILDSAAVKIVELASPYAPFPEDVREMADILSITRTWTFTPSNEFVESPP